MAATEEEVGRPLNLEFIEAEKQFEELENSSLSSTDPEYQDIVKSNFRKYLVIDQRLRSIGGFFSSNETVEDIQTSSLKYLLLPYFLGRLQLMVNDGRENRMGHLRLAKQYFQRYIQQIDQLEMLSHEDRKVYQRETVPNATTKREEVLSRAKRQNAAKERLTFLRKKNEQQLSKKGVSSFEEGEDNQSMDEEEFERETRIIVIHLATLKVLEELALTNEELDMLEHMDRMRNGGDSSSSSSSSAPKVRIPPPQTTKTYSQPLPPSALVGHERQQIVNRVFQKGWRQPTMSIEEAGEIDYCVAQEQSKRSAETEKRREQEKEDEDKNYDDDDNIRKLREWDDFKDANPTGSGNRINQG